MWAVTRFENRNREAGLAWGQHFKQGAQGSVSDEGGTETCRQAGRGRHPGGTQPERTARAKALSREHVCDEAASVAGLVAKGASVRVRPGREQSPDRVRLGGSWQALWILYDVSLEAHAAL